MLAKASGSVYILSHPRDQQLARGAHLRRYRLVISGTTPDNQLVEVIEVPAHPFFIASQFHPEFLSKPNRPHPLFRGFIAAAHQQQHKLPLPSSPRAAA